MSNSPSRRPTNASVLPSGDQPCQKLGAFVVSCFGVPPPPVIGSRYTLDVSQSSVGSWLTTSHLPSGEMPWSLFIRGVVKAMGSWSSCRDPTLRRYNRPSLFTRKYRPSRDQLGASK